MAENCSFIKDGVEVNRQKCQVYCRVMGYLRPVNNYNVGKKTEFYSRKYFYENAICPRSMELIESNRKFIEQFA